MLFFNETKKDWDLKEELIEFDMNYDGMTYVLIIVG